ncbi:MAG TPA: hypothetical protein VFG30_35810, partial [Polyangiales bacterium]|nr:hypothetical protein [Polyangiales bacterium]
MRRWAVVCCVLASFALAAADAHASDDSFGAGNGHHGDLDVSAPNTIVNHAASLIADVTPGDDELFVTGPADFLVGDLVMVWHTQGLARDDVSNDETPIELADKHVGRFEFARVVAKTSTSLLLAAPMLDGWPSTESQVVFIPEYTSVTVQATGALAALPWSSDDLTGGILAVFVRDELVNDGLMTAAGGGMSGGVLDQDATMTGGCSSANELAQFGAQRGEGL